jgi:hypothetical protein
MITSPRYAHTSKSGCEVHGSIDILDWRMEADPTHSVLIVESLHQAVNVLMIAWSMRNRIANTLLRIIRAHARPELEPVRTPRASMQICGDNRLMI